MKRAHHFCFVDHSRSLCQFTGRAQVSEQPAHRRGACYAGPDTNPVASARRLARTKRDAKPKEVARPVVGATVTFSTHTSAPVRGASVAEP